MDKSVQKSEQGKEKAEKINTENFVDIKSTRYKKRR